MRSATAMRCSAAVEPGQRMLTSAGVAFPRSYIAVPVTRFVGLEMIEGGRTPFRQRSVVAVTRVITVIHMTDPACRPVKPGACTNKHAAGKPIGAVVAVGSAVIRSVIKVTVRTDRRDSNIDGYLRRCDRCAAQTHSSKSRKSKNFPMRHKLPSKRIDSQNTGQVAFCTC